MSMIEPPRAGNLQLLRLSALLQMEEQARRAPAAELAFLMVNETAGIVPYQQAALWRPDGGLVLSGAGNADLDGPYAVWLKALFQGRARREDAGTMGVIPDVDIDPEWLPPHALWCPLPHPDGGLAGVLLFARSDAWDEGDMALLRALTASYAQSLVLAHLPKRRVFHRRGPSRARLAIAATVLVLVCAGLFPLRSSVLAPAEVVPVDPVPVRAPYAGVVDKIYVTPNATVRAGDKLLALDPGQVRSRVEVARKSLEMAQVEYAQVSQEALTDSRVRNRLALLKSKIDQQEAELGYQKTLLDRGEVPAQTGGIAVFNDASEWIGKPVELGERIMVIASPDAVELEMQVPVAEIATFDNGAEVLFFSNIEPDHAVKAHLTFASYASGPAPDGVLSYVFRARFDGAEPNLRLGLKGTAKVFGGRRPMALWLLRRPIAAVRLWLTI